MASAKTKGRTHQGIRQNLRGGVIADFVEVALVSGQAVTLDTDVFESRVRTNNSGEMVALLPIPTAAKPLTLGQRHLVSYALEQASGDSVAISGVTGASGSLINIERLVVSGVTNYAATAFTRVSLLAQNDQALFEYSGLSGTIHVWNLLYLRGTAIPS